MLPVVDSPHFNLEEEDPDLSDEMQPDLHLFKPQRGLQ